MEKIVCLGKTFNLEEERREYFKKELRNKLPELKKMEGFPIGEDEDIIALSDPPYYTACPNPWLNDFIAEWEKEKEGIQGRIKDFHVDEPYASDVSEGKNNPIYMAHSYHTKVPHPAIMRYILHYTQPGDIVFDGFSGTGMTGVAASMCGNPDNIVKYQIEQEWKSTFLNSPQWGFRKVLTSDISPFASFISHNYNKREDLTKIKYHAETIFHRLYKEFGWMYETKHQSDKYGKINYIVWSEVFSCSICNGEIVFWEEAINIEVGIINESFLCPHCKGKTDKKRMVRLFITVFDKCLSTTVRQPKYIPVLINYTFNNKRYEKKPDSYDIEILKRIDSTELEHWFPTASLPNGDKTNEPLRYGYTNAHHFYKKRTLIVLSAFWEQTQVSEVLKLLATSILIKTASILHNIGLKSGKINLAGALPNAIYIPSSIAERNIIELLKGKLNDFLKVGFNKFVTSPVQVSSASDLRNIKSESIDYIFADPPFGSNIMYSELNFLHESWLKVLTNIELEAIENKTQSKRLLEYQKIMTDCFIEYYRILKHKRWMTVEFSNTSAAVWNGIQTSLQKAGFIIANVSALDKKQGSFNAQTTPTAVKQDLVISCYKSSFEFEDRFLASNSEIAVWDFVKEHLNHLPIHIKKGNDTTSIIERSPKIIYDRMITYYLIRGLPIPIDARYFQEELKKRFVEKDGMYFLAEQVIEYDKKKVRTSQFIQLSLIVLNESDAIEWLKDRLQKCPQKYQDIMPDFRIATQSLRKGDMLPELQDILLENFIQEQDGKWRLVNINESRDLDIVRMKALLKEFNKYLEDNSKFKSKKLKEVRVEALRAGYKDCWDKRDFQTIVKVGDSIPKNILLEDEQLLMYYDIAKDRV